MVTREYNVFNQLIRSTRDGTTTEYGYNAHRQRAWKKTSDDVTVYVYDANSEKLLAEYKNGKLEKEYIYFDGRLVAVHSGTHNAVFFVQNDHLGRPQIVSNENQTIVWQTDNQSFDREVIKNDIGDLNIGFPGQYYDQESGLYYNINRDYDAKVGRYLQSDPIGLTGGLNTYTYVGNNPLVSVDPTGLIDLKIDGTSGQTTIHANPGPDVTDFRPEHEPHHVHLGSNSGPRIRTDTWQPVSDKDAKQLTRTQKNFIKDLSNEQKSVVSSRQLNVFKYGKTLSALLAAPILSLDTITAACRNDPIWCIENMPHVLDDYKSRCGKK